ncbi:MAG: DUF3828 domain-containing protein [Bacteroidaceae bacterium]|nr:DUF3828 domain-containing protein [Bacteroidaceae bacterium]
MKLTKLITMLLIAAPLLLTSCDQKERQAEQQSSAKSVKNEKEMRLENEVREQLVPFYKQLAHYYATNDLDKLDPAKLFATICTDRFNRLYKECDILSEKNGFCVLDYDVWIMAQDFDKVSFRIKDIKVKNDTTATTDVLINNMNTQNISHLMLKKHDSKWLVDDIYGELDGQPLPSACTDMEQFLITQ